MTVFLIILVVFMLIASSNNTNTSVGMSDYHKRTIDRRVMNKVIRRACVRRWK